MPKVALFNQTGSQVGDIELTESIFGLEPNKAVLHDAIVMQQASLRQGTHKTKGRSEVRGGGRKPWRQKGTGRARQGSIRSPQWVGGGVVFGPTPRSYSYKLPAKLYDGSYHDVDSSEMAYKVAASMALKAAGKKCDPVILEPIMAVEVTAPAEYLGSVMGDVSSRRGMIEGQEERGNAVTVQASIPLSEMFGYATDLRSFTQGRGNYTMIFDRYEPVPKSIREEIIKKNGGNN